MKLIRRSRLRGLTGETWGDSGEGFESARRSMPVGSVESIDQREAGGLRLTAGRRFTDDSGGEVREVAREANEG